MPEITLQDALQQAVTLHHAGKTEAALEIYHQILTAIPNQIDALKLSGVAQMQLGNVEQAIELLQKSVSLSPDYDDAHYNLGIAHQLVGQLQDAESSFRRVLELAPDNAAAMFNLGKVLHQLGDNNGAVDCFFKALEIKPDFVEVHFHIGNMCKGAGRLTEAADAYRKVIAIDPSHSAAIVNLGSVLIESGDLDEAEEALRKASQIHPDSAEIQLNLGAVHLEAGKLAIAEKAFRRALEIKPDFIEAQANLASILQKNGHITEADSLYTKALQIAPGRMDVFRNYLLNLLYLPGQTDDFIFSRNQAFAAAFSRPQSPIEPHNNIPDPNRKLKLGFISSDFRAHSVAYNVLPLLSNINHQNFESYLYAEVPNPDEMTARFQETCDNWRNIFGNPDEMVAGIIRNDGIDVLIFLAGHFDKNRLPLCVYRAAPVQVSFHDGATSGFEKMDYWLTDPVLHPKNTKERFTEELYRLPIFYQYTPIYNAPPISTPPMEKSGTITFGSFNNPAKINDQVIALWADILKAVPGSRLMLKYRSVFDNSVLREKWLDRFAVFDIPRERIVMGRGMADSADHLALYNEVDIALDPFPFTGATTTFEALWMGVPVITLMGGTFVSRMAGSILHHAGHNELTAQTPADYVTLARDLANDPERLKSLRENLRQELQHSPLCDSPAYARSVEAAFRDMWKKWCNGQQA